MASKAGKGLLVEVRDAVLSRSLETLSSQEITGAVELPLDHRGIMAALLDLAVSPDGEEAAAARCELLNIARQLCRHGISWSAVDGLGQALMCSAVEHLDGRGAPAQLSAIGAGLLQAQAFLFDAFMEAEREKRERVSQQLHEVDRFPDTIASTLDPPTLTKVGLARLREILGMESSTMFEVSASHRLTAIAGDLAIAGGTRGAYNLSEQAAAALLERGDPYWLERGGDGPFAEDGTGPLATGTAVLLPMVVRGRTTGVVHLSGAAASSLSSEDMEIAVRFSSRLAVALENAYLHEREQRKIKETVALLEITRAINSTLDLEHILEKVVQMIVDLCGVAMCAVFLYESDTGHFRPSAFCGFIAEGEWRECAGDGFSASGLQAARMKTLEQGEPLFIPAEEAGHLISPQLLHEHGVDLVLVFPLSSRERLSGAFALFYPCREAEGLDMEEVEVIRAIASQASMAIENASLYEDIEKSYFSTVRALAKAIEVKDPYTHGHSERVTEYALMIADAMQMDERERQKLKYAATLHDIGKIGIAGRVLNKPGGLTREEYTHVKTHPILGESIVEPVEFLQGPRPIILHHHERFDGTGYPQGLKGTAIPICARILSVADAFEAMRSDRPYRRALPLQTAVEELKRNSGSQFDPEVVDAFLRILEERGGDPVTR
ncbi:MAG: HD domain-containing phosphohydrolase [Actinomycetota bacterium]